MDWVYTATTVAFAAVFLYEHIRASREGRNLVLEMLQAMKELAREWGEHLVGSEKHLRACAVGVGLGTLVLCAPAVAAIGSIVQPFNIAEWPWRLGFVVCTAVLLPIGFPAAVWLNRWICRLLNA